MQKALLPTIYSRCQVWNLLPPDIDTALPWLQSQTSAEISDILTALRVNYGRPLLALAMLEQNLLAQRREFLRQFWLFYRRCSPLELLPFFTKELVLQQLDWLLAFLSDSLKNKLHIHEDWICQDIEQGVIQFSQGLSAPALLKATQIVGKVRSDLSANSALNLELILLDGLTRLITEVFEG